jgi:hypothetical protein
VGVQFFWQVVVPSEKFRVHLPRDKSLWRGKERNKTLARAPQQNFEKSFWAWSRLEAFFWLVVRDPPLCDPLGPGNFVFTRSQNNRVSPELQFVGQGQPLDEVGRWKKNNTTTTQHALAK